MLKFIIRTMVGGVFGIVTMCLCIVAGDSDRQLDNTDR